MSFVVSYNIVVIVNRFLTVNVDDGATEFPINASND